MREKCIPGGLIIVNLFWLYDIPTWALFALIMTALTAFSLAGCLVFRKLLDGWLGLSADTNDIVGYFLSFTGAFYGIMLGLVAVGAWETFKDANGAVEQEASVAAALYRDVMHLPFPHDGRGQSLMRTYVEKVIVDEWPIQRAGGVPKSGDDLINELGAEISLAAIKFPAQNILTAEALSQYNKLLEARRNRIQSAQNALPASLWYVIVGGAFLNIFMTWLLWISNERLDLTINLIMAALLGSVLAFIIAMDNPYRGELSVSPDALRDVYRSVMDGTVLEE